MENITNIEITSKSRRAPLRSMTYLRGVAALLVFYGHVFVVGMTDPVTPKRYLSMIDPVPFLPNDQFSVFSLTPAIWLNATSIGQSVSALNVGEIGVGIFFLISGYLIISLSGRLRAKNFLIGRFFRVIPTFISVTIIGYFCFSSYLNFRGYQQTYILSDMIKSALLLPTVMPPVPVVWSLIVEAWFYLIIAGVLIFKPTITWTVDKVAAVGVTCFFLVFVITSLRVYLDNGQSSLNLTLWYISYNLTFVIFILIGSVINLSFLSKQFFNGFIAVCGFMGLFFEAIHLHESAFHLPMGFTLLSALASAIVFSVALLCESLIPKIAALQFFADISYPLYLVHIPLAWLILFWMQKHLIGGIVALPAVSAICVALAWLAHIIIERPSHQIGRSLQAARRPFGAPLPQQAEKVI